jgi:hypothetical protein
MKANESLEPMPVGPCSVSLRLDPHQPPQSLNFGSLDARFA